MQDIGEITKEIFNEVEQYYEVDWTIKDIFSCTEQYEEYYSPSFETDALYWYLSITVNGNFEEQKVGWIRLYLHIAEFDYSTPRTVNFTFGVRKVDGKIEIFGEDVSCVFREIDDNYGEDKLLKTSELLERRSELAPSEVLTVTCTLRVNVACDFTSRVVNLSSTLKKLFISKMGCDATLKVQNEEFPVHTAILSLRSSVFEAMFGTEMKEKQTGVVEIVDCHPGSFKDFLLYIYSGQFENSSGDIFELYKIAHKYCVEELKELCVLYIKRNISVSNVIDVTVLGHQYDVDELKTKSQDFFDKNVASVFRTDKWKSLLRNDPALAQDLLINMTKEMEIKKK